jgi:hypothetical protein
MTRFFSWFRRSESLAREQSEDSTSSSSEYSIENAWRDYFAPVARELGFKGSGRHFRRIEGQYVQTVNLQGSQYGGKFAVNLGLQPLGVPAVLGRDFDPKSVKEIECLFRNRLTYDGCDTWWSYNADAQSRVEAAKSAGCLLRTAVDGYFKKRIEFVENVTPDELGRAAHDVHVGLALLRERQNNIPQAQKFAKLAVERMPPRYWKEHSPIKHLVID